jgi:cytochrome oxidase Cu insertion factor (SCO1/SenC/PrrC family)
MNASRIRRIAIAPFLVYLATLGSVARPAIASIEDLLFDIQIVSLERKPARDFTLEDLSGKGVSLSDFRGRLVMIYFWATW